MVQILRLDQMNFKRGGLAQLTGKPFSIVALSRSSSGGFHPDALEAVAEFVRAQRIVFRAARRGRLKLPELRWCP